MSLKRHLFIAWILIGLVPVFGYALAQRYKIPIGDSPSLGPENAPVTIVEFIDYQ
jgi:protein-disulfide isomerase